MVNGHVVVISNNLINHNILVSTLLECGLNDAEVYDKLLAIKQDYNSKFINDYGLTLEKYEMLHFFKTLLNQRF